MSSRRTRNGATSAPVWNHGQADTPPATLMGSPKGLATPWKWTLLPVVAMSISAGLYTLANPFVDGKLPDVSTNPQLWHQIAPIASKIVMLCITWALNLDGNTRPL